MISFPKIDPVAIHLGDYFAIRWYSLAYILSIIVAFYFTKRIISKKNHPLYSLRTSIWDFVPYAVFGIIIGGRLGHVIFYNPINYLMNPLSIFALWEGGMSFHGGFIGISLAAYFFSRKQKVSFFALVDIMALMGPIGLFFGRITNFINDELYGTPSNVLWAVNFPSGGGIPRHPVQIYEALLEGVVLFLILIFIYRKYNKNIGITSSVFLIFYGIFRFFAEYFKVEETPLPAMLSFITMGQLLSLPMIILGIVLLFKHRIGNKK